MENSMYKFEVPSHHRSIIKVVGVGGGGSNAVNFMFNQGIRDVEFIVCNTDAQALKLSPVPNKLQIGGTLTDGLGAGTDPERGRQSAIEDKELIRESLQGTKMLFITAGMGGGTGTGAAPVLAKIASEMDILTVGIVTAPFGFEGRKKREIAEQGINEMKQYCDTVIVILNDKIREMFGNLPINQAFSRADNVLTTAAKSIAEIITIPGQLNIDFADVEKVMKKSGTAVMGSAVAGGPDRALLASEKALNSPLLNNTDITGANRILVSIMVADEDTFSMDEFAVINDYFQDQAGDAELKTGISVDSALGENIRVTVIATGFDEKTAGIGASVPATFKEPVEFYSEPKVQIPVPEVKVEAPRPEAHLPPPTEEKAKIQQAAIDFEIRMRNDDAAETARPQAPMAEKPVDQHVQEEKKYMDLDENPFDRLRETRSRIPDKEMKDRLERLKRLSKGISFTGNLNHTDEPAFIRKKVKLNDAPHSSERNISRLYLNDDNEITGNNRFLYDNVD